MGEISDTPAVAALHATEITEGFLTSLGPRFLARLYRRVVLAPGSFMVVAGAPGTVGGFAATSVDLRALYQAFLIRDGLWTALLAAPRLARSWPMVLETLRYPAASTVGSQSLPRAELLAVAVRPDLRGRGIGRALVNAVTANLEQRGVRAARVAAAADNQSALRLYEACGFRRVGRVDVHAGTPSEMLIWP